jgi:hypothetical protein
MKERPILFSTSMVRAILEWRKTQTRRTLKKQPNIDPQTGDWLFTFSDGKQEVHPIKEWIDIHVKLRCPYGKVGDRLWVRETFGFHPDYNPPYNFDGPYVYRATDPDWETTENWKWKPSIFMPRHSSRITLEITEIRIERLQDITESDAIAEGVELLDKGRLIPSREYQGLTYKNYEGWKDYSESGTWIEDGRMVQGRFIHAGTCNGPITSYASLWRAINGQDSWQQNPFVWVVSFKMI